MGCNNLITSNSGSKQLERTRYFSKMLVTADDLTKDQNYYLEKRRLHNRLLHGWGIVCGLEVRGNPKSGAPLNVTICPGYALSPQGDEIYVPTEIQFDIERCIVGQSAPCHSPCAPVVPDDVISTMPFYIAIKYDECMSHPVRVPPVGCGCDDTVCEYSRIRDSYEVRCLGSLPDSDGENYQVQNTLCDAVNTSKVVAFLPCPESPWIVLAKVEIEVNVDQIRAPVLYSDCRRVLLSTALIQAHLQAECS